MVSTAKTGERSFPVLLEILLSILMIVGMGVGFCAVYRYFFHAAYPMRYSEEVQRYSEEFRISPALIYAVIRTESGFQPEARSGADARGLMQVTEETFEWARYRLAEELPLEFDELYDPATNIRYGTAILRLHLDEFGSLENALCAYHAGAGSVQKWLEDRHISPDGRSIERIPIRQTKHYLDKVLEAQRLYETLYGL